MERRHVEDLDVCTVAPAMVPTLSTPGLWPCSSCGEGYDVHRTYLVDHFDAGWRRVVRQYVCDACAQLARRRLARGSGTNAVDDQHRAAQPEGRRRARRSRLGPGGG